MRAIDADKLKKVLEMNFGHTGGAAVLAQLIDAQDAIQPEIVRCKDCKHYECGICKKAGLCVNKSPNGFCDWGEEREVTT